MKQKLTTEQILKVEIKYDELRSKIQERSTDLAEVEHHAECPLKCCGSHQQNEQGVCMVCGLDADQIDDHNMEVWEIIDAVEGDDDQCVMWQHTLDCFECLIKRELS